MNSSLKKQMRVESILSSLSKMDYLTQAQIQAIHDLKGDRNANRILHSMSEYLNSFRNELELVYHLNKNGREYIGNNIVRKKTQNVEHFLLRNQLWIHLKRPVTWRNEVKIKAGNVSVVCDAKFEYKGLPAFVEVDNNQSMAVNKQKIEKYRKIKELTDQKFYLMWVTKFPSRKKKLVELSTGLNVHVFVSEEIK